MHPNCTIMANGHVAGGSHPSYVQGYQERDDAYYKDCDGISRDRGVCRLDELAQGVRQVGRAWR